MNRADLARELGPPGPVVIDTSVVIAYLDGGDAFSATANVLLDDLVAGGTHPAVLSAVTVTECLVRPYRAGPEAVSTVAAFLGHFPNLRVRPIDAEVASEAARVRALTGLRTPDAMVIATALAEGVPFVVTADGGWRRVSDVVAGLRVICLEALEP